MIRIKKKLFFLNITEAWFEYKFRFSDLVFPVIYKNVKNIDQKFYFGKLGYDYTVEIDLGQPLDIILSTFRPHVRADIRRAEREGIHCYFDNDLDKFIPYFNEFAASKKIKPVNRVRLEEMAKHLRICYAESNGTILVAHACLEDKETGIIMGFHSASLRFDEKFDRNQIARANKLLHYYDVKVFKEEGIKTYDLGSYHVGQGMDGLLEFKQSIGGKVFKRAYFMTFSYYLIYQLQQLVQFLKKRGK